MKKLLSLLFASVFFFASCSVPERDNPFDPDGINYRPSINVIYGTPVNYEGETYETVVIGEQTWFKRNLNYAIEGSKCYGEDGQVRVNDNWITISNSEIQANCDTYGRLYNWITAMALDTSCNIKTCASQIGIKRQGICPGGWHIPNEADWNALKTVVGSKEGTKLKSADLWNSVSDVPKGIDKYGFSALPGGSGAPDGAYTDVGKTGHWWIASEVGIYFAFCLDMNSSSEDVYYTTYSKSNLFSVRCVKD